jgi:hypothetical protein
MSKKHLGHGDKLCELARARLRRARVRRVTRAPSPARARSEQFWSSIAKEKLDTLKYCLLHSGINTVGLQNDDELTALQYAASGNKPKALLLLLDTMQRQRCLKEAVDVKNEDGKTALMMAAAGGHVKCVDHL